MLPQWLLDRCEWVGDCLICNLTPSQVYANITGYGKAHRYSYHMQKENPGDLFVCHSCDTPRCINIDHLFLGTELDNMQDKVAKGRWRGGPNKTLPVQAFVQIIAMRYEGLTYKEIGAKFNVSRRTITRHLTIPFHE